MRSFMIYMDHRERPEAYCLFYAMYLFGNWMQVEELWSQVKYFRGGNFVKNIFSLLSYLKLLENICFYCSFYKLPLVGWFAYLFLGILLLLFYSKQQSHTQ